MEGMDTDREAVKGMDALSSIDRGKPKRRISYYI